MTNRSHTRHRMAGNNPVGATCIGLCVAIIVAGLALAGCGERESQVPPDAAQTSLQVSEQPSFSEGGGEVPGLGDSPRDREGSIADQNNPEQPASGDPGALARQELATLQIKGRAPKQGYARDQFGQRWKDIDRNGCDQRNDVLARDLQDVDAPGGCKVLSGVLHDPYTGQTINFMRGQETSALVQIDHVVAMADAWQKGAQGWTPERREEFGNDLENLLAVDGSQNQKKGAGDAATWLPPNKNFRCQYVSIQIHVKAKYGLWVTPAEHDAMIRELDQC